MNNQRAADMFESLASSVRLDVYRLLVKAAPDGKVAGQIASELDVPPSNLSFHLKALVATGLLTVVQEGRFLRYRAHLGLMSELISFLTNECCDGHPEYCVQCSAVIPMQTVGRSSNVHS